MSMLIYMRQTRTSADGCGDMTNDISVAPGLEGVPVSVPSPIDGDGRIGAA
jgi:hypothetical protein